MPRNRLRAFVRHLPPAWCAYKASSCRQQCDVFPQRCRPMRCGWLAPFLTRRFDKCLRRSTSGYSGTGSAHAQGLCCRLFLKMESGAPQMRSSHISIHQPAFHLRRWCSPCRLLRSRGASHRWRMRQTQGHRWKVFFDTSLRCFRSGQRCLRLASRVADLQAGNVRHLGTEVPMNAQMNARMEAQ